MHMLHYIGRRYSALRYTDWDDMKKKPPPTAESLLPLPPATFHILLALAGGELHGYAIMKEVSDASGGI